MKFTVFVSLALALCAIVSAQMEDLRLTEGATGAAVVHAVVDTIQESGIFSDDNKLLRRIAYVATQDGEAKSVNSRGRFGMWQLQADAFVETWTNMNIQSQRDAILETFGIDWLLVVPKDLSIPLYGGLAARLFLATIPEPIPAQENIEGQASYWKSYYGTARQDGTPTEFTVEVFRLEQIERCVSVGVDLIFLLDSSGSIDTFEYAQMLEFVKNLISVLDIGPDQTRVGVTVYSSSVETSFLLNTYLDKTSLVNAVDSVRKIGGGTDTAAGLREVLNVGFQEGNGVRNSSQGIPRVLFVLTDGVSNDFNDTVAAANEIHGQTPQIQVYAVGIGDGIGEAELEEIATRPSNVIRLSSFSSEEFQSVGNKLSAETCQSAAHAQVGGESVENDLMEGQQARVSFDCPQEGITVRICAPTGQVKAYGSHCTRNPSEAVYDFMFIIEAGTCDDIYERCGSCNQGMGGQRRRRQLATEGGVVYMVIEGVEEEETNSFVLDTTVGDTSTPKVNLRCIKQQRGELLTVTCTSNQDLANVSCSYGEQPFEPCSLPLELHLSVAGAGEHALQIQVTDILDLQDQSNIEYSVGPLNLRCQGEMTMDVYAVQCRPTNPLVMVMCSYDQDPLHTCTLPYVKDVTHATFGDHTIRIVGVDIFNLTSDVILTYTKPRMQIHLINSSPRVRSASVYIDFDVSRHAISLVCYLRQAQQLASGSGHLELIPELRVDEKDCSSKLVVFSSLFPGEYEFTVVGNASDGDSAFLQRNFRIREASSDCTVHLINDGVTVEGDTASVQFNRVGAFSSYQCSIDGNIQRGICRSPLRLRNLLPGAHLVEVVPQGCQGMAYGLSKTFFVKTD